MLASLRKADSRSRSAALTAAASYLLPEPVEDMPAPEGLVADVIGEINKKITVNRGAEFTTLLKQRLVTKELQDSILAGADVKEIRQRIGKKGLLSPSLYDVRFNQTFVELNVPMGVSKTLAQRAIANPIRVEHLFPEQRGIVGLDEQSLFTGPVPGRADCCVVVLAARQGATLSVDGAWLVFFEDVDVDPFAQPSEVLGALANKYGNSLRVGDFEGKFLLLKTFEHRTGATVQWATGNRAMDMRTSWMVTPGLLKVAIAFSIDLVSYTQDLKRHGISVSREIPPGPKENLVQLTLQADPSNAHG
jgi:hypothetical protein